MYLPENKAIISILIAVHFSGGWFACEGIWKN